MLAIRPDDLRGRRCLFLDITLVLLCPAHQRTRARPADSTRTRLFELRNPHDLQLHHKRRSRTFVSSGINLFPRRARNIRGRTKCYSGNDCTQTRRCRRCPSPRSSRIAGWRACSGSVLRRQWQFTRAESSPKSCRRWNLKPNALILPKKQAWRPDECVYLLHAVVSIRHVGSWHDQPASPRFSVPISAAALASDRIWRNP